MSSLPTHNHGSLKDPQLRDEKCFCLSSLDTAIPEFLALASDDSQILPLGWFISFEPITSSQDSIGNLVVKKLTLDLNNSNGAPDANGEIGRLTSETLDTVRVLPRALYHYPSASNGHQATRAQIKQDLPILRLFRIGTDLPGNVGLLRGYDEGVKAVFLSYSDLWRMDLAYRNIPEGATLKYVFTGAEIHHGEMASPLNQHLRYNATRGDIIDPSKAFTLKAEPVYKYPDKNYFESFNIGTYFDPASTDIRIADMIVASPCKIYWRIPGELSFFLALFFSWTEKKQKYWISVQNSFLRYATPTSLRDLVEKDTDIVMYDK